MFWRFGGYANISTIDTILDKDNFQLEDLLDESDLIQELKQHNAKLVEYLRDQPVLEKLLEYVVAPKLAPVATPEDDQEGDREEKGKGLSLPFSRPRASSSATDASSEQEESEKKRNKYAFVAAEILSSDNWSIYEALMESKALLRSFWQFLKLPAPLDPLQASYFTKVNESLFDKKTEEMIEFLKSIEGAIPDMIRHVDSPMIMDLLLKIISLERTESGQGIVEWLYTQDVIPTLLSFLGAEHSWSTQTSAGDFMKAIITVSANASQNEQTCIGPNELTRQLVSKPCVEQLVKYMLGGGNPLTVGVGIVIEVIRKNNSDYDPDTTTEADTCPSSRDPIYLGTLLRLFAQHVPDFMNLIMNAPAQKDRLDSTFGQKIEPLGFDRFKTCELMAELLHCSNMGLLNEPGAEELIAARDEERRRLRAEGTLHLNRGPQQVEVPEGLMMRMSHSSTDESTRRLEVTNSSAEDDGFEEVTHAGDDDGTHGVEDIPELPEAPANPPASSFLDKDEDDFVDEPLSSPRLNVRELDAEDEHRLDDPELMVPPLSPTKQKAVLAVEATEATTQDKETSEDTKTEEAKTEVPSTEVGDLSLEEKQPNVEADKGPGSETSEHSETPIMTPAASEPEQPVSQETDGEGKPDEEKAPSPERMSPHPEDKPAPLFSGSTEPAKAAPAEDSAAEAVSAEGAESEARITLDDALAGVGAGSFPAQFATHDHEPGSTSVIVDRGAGADDEEIDLTPPPRKPYITPVVGDFLKIQFVEHRVVPTILEFFFKYPWNNFLHNVVYDIVQQVFNGPMDRGYNPTLATSLFEAADVTTQIINGQQASEESQTKNKTRMGYMGHLTLIAEEVVKFTERHPPELLSETVVERVMAHDWINYVEGALAETRERDNAILGGVRPEVAMSNRAGTSGLAGVGLSGLGSLGFGGSGGGSNALAEAGLNGGSDLQEQSGGNGIGPFAISAGTLMSGFGSSSDEDEDEDQESEEDVNNEFRAYTDPLNANNSTSMNPPSIPPPPPPPPPLNIPPSRARLQLAARLAMNKRNAAATASVNGQDGADGDVGASGTFSLPSVTATERLRNPFADDEDDEDGGSGSGSGSEDGDGDNVDGEGGVGSSSWNRGSWWRGVVRRARRGERQGSLDKIETEPFGDGRDSSDGSNGPGDEEDVDEEMGDEEFGDFAMPEVEGGGSDSHADETVTGIDPSREKILLKPLPVHPSAPKAGASPFGSLWPFSSQGFSNKEKKEEKDGSEPENAAESKPAARASEEKAATKGPADAEEPVVGEDGHKIDRAIEAKRRTSIEDPDDDDDDVDAGEEIIVGRPELA